MINRRTLLLAAGGALALPRLARAQDIGPQAVFHDPDAPALGNPKGDVTLVEFFDYQCPYCKSNHPVIEAAMRADQGLRVVMKDWPIFGAPSLYASQLVLGAQSFGGYSRALEALMATRGKLSPALIEEVLRKAGIDPDKAEAGYKANRTKIDALLARNYGQAVALGLQGTPAYVIGRDIYPGVIDAETLRAAIAEARKS